MFALIFVLGGVASHASTSTNTVAYPLRWRWSNPDPHGGNVVDMAYSPSLGLAVQVAERGQIFTSGDLDLWLPRDTFLTNNLRAVTFFGTRAIVAGENGLVLYADNVTQWQPGTLADGATTDWLEAVTASPNLLVAAGDNGSIYTSANGVTWKKQNSGTNTWFRGAANGGGTFVVVGEDGAVLTSSNGTNWTKRATSTTNALNRVSYGLGKFTAVGDAGVTISSTNSGVTWFNESTGATNTLQYAVAGGTDRLVNGTNEVRIQDGGVWTDQLANTNGPPAWSYYCALGSAGFFLIAGQTGMQSEGYQTNTAPYFWLTPYDSVRNWLWDAMRLPSFYITVGDYGTVMTSGNGVDWTLELIPGSVTNTTFLGVGGTTNLLLAVGDGGAVIYSPNILSNVVVTNATGGVSTQTVSSIGVTWFTVPAKPTTNDLQGVATLSNTLFVVTGGRGSIYTTADATNWTARSSGTTNILTSVAEWSGGLVAVGDNGTLLTSSNGVTWSSRSSGTSNWLFRARWLNGTLVAVGQNGTILTSTNGTGWTNRASGTTAWLNDVTFVGDTWFAIGVNGTVLTSTNLVNWTNRGTITKKALYGAATDGSQLVLAGVEGCILRSQVLPDTTPVSFLNFDRTATNGISYNLYLFGGQTDQRFRLDRITNFSGAPWSTGATLEIFDGSGTLYYLETISGTNQPLMEYYRTTLVP